ncbi:MAG: superoxide dismutase [Gammaproteobacteria bacterium]
MFELINLPYEDTALEPVLSRETLRFHHGRHHRTYVDKLNALLNDNPRAVRSLDDLVRTADGALFNNAAQAWNHDFYWLGLRPRPGQPDRRLLNQLRASFGGEAKFRSEFTRKASAHFGVGWAWLTAHMDGTLEVQCTSDADTPLRHGSQALLACDLWEHAYYIDYRDSRTRYLHAFWEIVDWETVSDRFDATMSQARRSDLKRRSG